MKKAPEKRSYNLWKDWAIPKLKYCYSQIKE